MSTGWVLLVVLVVLLAAAVLIYNGLVIHRNRFRNAFSQIDVQLQRRHELIPNLVETARAYMKHERDTLESVTQARNAAEKHRSAASAAPENASLVGALAQAEQSLGSALGKFNMVMENYPDLKADVQMRDLHDELSSTDNRVAYARQAYSDAVMRYNTAREQFPSVLIASGLGFREADLFEVEDRAMAEPVKVSFA